jgi:hypothetical protein
MLGRVLSPDEDQPGRSHVVVLSHKLWQEHFGANPDIVGRNVNLDDQAYFVAGVMPANFQYPDFAQMWTPMAWTDKEREVRGEHHYGVIAHLKPGVELKQAQTEMDTISQRLEQSYPEDDKGWGAVVVPLHDDLVGDVRPALLVLLGAVAFVLLIACVNVANLALARPSAARKRSQFEVHWALVPAACCAKSSLSPCSSHLREERSALPMHILEFGCWLLSSQTNCPSPSISVSTGRFFFLLPQFRL